MSNDGRLSLGEKMQRAVIPDSQKSTGTQAKESTQGKGDNMLKHMQPSSNKTGPQAAADQSTSNNDTSFTDKIKNVVGMNKD